MRVIVVDDHALFRGGLISLFRSQPDFEVVGEAGTIQEALFLLESQHPDLILMDLGLPDGSGIEAIPKILAKRPRVRIVVLTIHASDELAFSAIRLGAHGFLLKDIAAPGLLAALRGLERGELAVSRPVIGHFVGEILHFISPRSWDDGRVHASLTPRQIQVLAELASGDGNREIATRLSVSENTVKVHVHNILHKLELRSRQDAAEYARRHGLARGGSKWQKEGIV